MRQNKGRVPVWLIIVLSLVALCGLFCCVISVILYPVFGGARTKARQTLCKGNLKQLWIAQVMYSQDYDERFPVASQWGDLTEPYVKNSENYRCPSVPNKSDFGYAMNTAFSQKTYEAIPDLKQTILLYDSTDLTWNANDKLASLPDPGRHEGKNFVVYGDGHAESIEGGTAK